MKYDIDPHEVLFTRAADTVARALQHVTRAPWQPDFHYELPCRCGDCPDDGEHVIHVSPADQQWFCVFDPGFGGALVALFRDAAHAAHIGREPEHSLVVFARWVLIRAEQVQTPEQHRAVEQAKAFAGKGVAETYPKG